jgi:DNA replication protein DnaC
MGYNRENYRRIRAEYENKYKKARESADRRRAEVSERIPGIHEIDTELGRVGLEIMSAIMSAGDTDLLVAKIRSKNEYLQKKREELLIKNGYPADYTDVKYECPLCSDSGYAGGHMCECMRRELILAGCESSGIGQLMKEQNFDNFSLDYYSKSIDTYSEMENVLTAVYRFANNFSETNSGNLAFIGGTGLGKTHLSSAVARRVIERGFDVSYVSAQGMISDFENERFGNSSAAGGGGEINRYFDCDLLIIDDLGTEVTNQFTIACLYNVINTRLNLKKSTVISANLKQDELRQRYSDRITSRILGEYRILRFVGTDVRAQKIGIKK